MKKLALILCVLLLPNISYSVVITPSPLVNTVNGTFNHGNYITISGSGFGSKSPAKPLVWAPFEGGTTAADSNLSATTLDSNTYQLDTTNQPHSRSTYSVSNMAKTNEVKTAKFVSVNTNTGQFFVFARRKFPATIWANTSNFKTFWGYPAVLGCANNPKPLVNMVVDRLSWFAVSYQGGAHTTGGGQVGPISGYYPPDDGSWTTWEMQEKKGTIDTYDGSFKFWINGQRIANWTPKNVTTTYPTDTYCTLVLGDFWTDSVPGKGYLNNVKDFLDDVYMDKTWARAMIGNASTFDACTHREPLIPTAWSGTSITAYFNQGSFPNGSKVYLFVIDSNGNASRGKEIIIGGTASLEDKPNLTDIPNPPLNLHIQ